MTRSAYPRSVLMYAVMTIWGIASTFAQEPAPKAVAPEEPVAKPSPATDQLTKIVESMRGIEARLKDRKTDEDTQSAQQSVLDQLDQLLNMPPDQNPPSNGSGGGGSTSHNQKPPPNGGQSTRRQNSSSKSGQKQAGDPSQMRPKPAGQSGNKDRTNAQDSEERTGPNRAATNPASKRQRLEVEIWGHLPEKLREQLLSSYGEKMLPQYEDAVRKFYDELANPSHGKSNSSR